MRAPAGVEVRGYVPDLYRELAACDIAVVQGGLTTTMELVAARRPFLYFPSAHHFEQQIHVAHRLARYRAGRRMDYATAVPEVIADAIAAELGATVDYLPVAHRRRATRGAAPPRRALVNGPAHTPADTSEVARPATGCPGTRFTSRRAAAPVPARAGP